MQLAVILENAPGCVLSREVVEIADEPDGGYAGDAIDDAVSKILETWTFSLDDTIKIREVGRED